MLLHISKLSGNIKLNSVSVKFHLIFTSQIFKDVNENIEKLLHPPLAKVRKKPENKGVSEVELFKCIIKELHTKAAKLNCDNDVPYDLNPEKRLDWEWMHCKTLAATVNAKYQEVKPLKEIVNEVEASENWNAIKFVRIAYQLMLFCSPTY